MKRSGGSTLLTTIVFLSVVATVGLSLAGLSVQHLGAAGTQENRQQSLLLARSAVSLGLSRLMQDPDFGKQSSGSSSDLLEVRLPDARPNASGRLTFSPQLARQHGLAYSTNNLEASQSQVGAEGKRVPQNSVLLIGEGRCGGVVRRVQAVLAVPPFPYAVASAGPVDAREGVTIAGLSTGADPESGEALFLPANLLSNDDGNRAIFLGPNTKVTGDVKAAGVVALDPNALDAIEILGRVTSGAAREKIPQIPLASYDPQVGSSPFTILTADPEGRANLSGIFRRQGNLTCRQGLFMDGGVLYVDGDLNVQGGLSGKGMVVATGAFTVEGQSDLRSGNGLAVLAGGNLKVQGSGAMGSFFQGLLYTEGSFEADRVTVVGTVIAADESNAPPVVLRNARVFHSDGGKVVLPGASGRTFAPLTPEVELTEFPSIGPPFPNYRTRTVFLRDGAGNLLVEIFAEAGSEGLGSALPLASGAITLGRTPTEIRANLIVAYQSALDLNPGWQGILDNWVSGLPIYDVGGPVTGSTGTSAGNPVVTDPAAVTLFDPSSFLHLVDRTRVVMWKEL